MSSLELAREQLAQQLSHHKYGHHVVSLGKASLHAHRTIAVAESFAEVLQRAQLPLGLVRGRVYQCTGIAPMSLAVGLVQKATAEGSWVGWCANEHLNWGAARNAGWCLERVVQVSCDEHWCDAVVALASGVEVLVVNIPAHVSPSSVRRTMLSAAVQQCAVVALGPTHGVSADVVFTATGRTWLKENEMQEQVAFAAQELSVHVGGRRVPSEHYFSLLVG